MEILILKVILLFTLFITCLVASLTPLKFVDIAGRREGGERRRHLIERILRFLNCFGGGVFLATCLLDLLPDVERKFAAVLSTLNIHTNFPIAEFVAAVGLFLILSVEQIAYDCKERTHRGRIGTTEADTEKYDKSGHLQTEDVVSSVKENTKDSETSPLLQNSQAHGSGTASSRTSDSEHHSSSEKNVADTYTTDSRTSGHSHGHSHGTLHSSTGDKALIQHTDSHDMVTSSSLRSLLLLLALSLHSLFEGLALGLQSNVSQLLGIFAAIVIHKTILALSLGINFVQSNLRARTVIQSSICFAIMAPIGIVIGIVVMQGFDTNAHNITSGILQGLATGTFLYITFFEVLPMEMSQPGDRLLKVLCTILGFAIIVGALFLDPTITKPHAKP